MKLHVATLQRVGSEVERVRGWAHMGTRLGSGYEVGQRVRGWVVGVNKVGQEGISPDLLCPTYPLDATVAPAR